MFWVDQLVENLLQTNKKTSYQVNDYKTPSGKIHIGSLRGVVLHDLIRQGLINQDIKADFTYGFDDLDPMDGFPAGLDESFRQYMGMPLCDIPSPKKGFKSFADYFAKDFKTAIEYVGIKPNYINSSDLYRNGDFNKAIEIALKNNKKIQKIYTQVSGSKKHANWYPFSVVCPKCKKIGTTNVFDFDGNEVSFKCEEKMVLWATGCGYEGKISPYNGNGKLPWKVEWPAKWYILKNDVEGSGKDHMTKTGSFAVASEIAKQVYKINPPFAPAYEWFLVKGSKMSTSKGVGSAASDMTKILPPEIMKFLITKPKYKSTIDFSPEGMAIPTLFDNFIDSFNAYLQDAKLDLGKAYLYSKIDINSKDPQYLMRFSKIAIFLQMPRVDIVEYAEKEKGSKLTETDLNYLNNWLKFAKIWLKRFAPDDFKFEIQEQNPMVNLNDMNIKFLKMLYDYLNTENKLPDGETIHKQIHKIKTDNNIPAQDVFQSIYKIFLNKDSGPQAGWFIANLDKKFVLERIKKYL